MTRRIIIISFAILCGMLCWSQNTATKASQRLSHLPTEAPVPALAKYVSSLMTCDSNPLSYLPILSQLDSVASLLNRFESVNATGFDQFIADLHTLADANDALSKPFDGAVINDLTGRLDSLSLETNSPGIDSIKYAITNYYPITRNLKELLTDMIDGQKSYMAADSEDDKAEILKGIDENLMFEQRNDRLSRIPYMRAQLDIVFKSCPRDEDGNLLPESFDAEKLQELFQTNEQARSTYVKDTDKKSKDKDKKSKDKGSKGKGKK